MKKIPLALLGIVLLGAILRFYHNLDISLWHDEAFSALLIHYPWQEMIYRIGLDVHPPAYYIALRLWHYAFGGSLLSLRGFSVFFGLATVVMAYAFVKQAFRSTKAAFITALLVAISPFQIQYASEARMYTFGAFLAVFAAYVLVKALQEANRRKQTFIFIFFGILSGLAALTHYYLLFTVAALCLYGLLHQVYYYRTKLNHYAPLIAGYTVAGLVFLPWLQWFLFQYKQVGSGYWIPPLDQWSIPTTLWQMLLGIGVDISRRPTQIGVILVTIFSVYVLVQFVRKAQSPHSWLVLFALLAPFGGSLLFAVLAYLKGENSSVYLVRYFLYASTFYSIALAVWLSKIRYRYIAYTLLTLYVIANLGAFWRFWTDLDVRTKPGMAAASEYLLRSVSRTNSGNPDKIIVGSSFEFFNLKYYLAEKSTGLIPSGYPPLKDPPINGKCRIDCLYFDGIPRPLLYSGGQETIDSMPHFAGTAILTNQDLLPHMEKATAPGGIIWLLWTNGFGSNKPTVPNNWQQIDEAGFAEVRPYVGTWIVVTKYLVQ